MKKLVISVGSQKVLSSNIFSLYLHRKGYYYLEITDTEHDYGIRIAR